MPNSVWKDVPDDQIASFMWFDKAKKWPITTAAYGVSEANEQYTNYDLWLSWWAVETGFVARNLPPGASNNSPSPMTPWLPNC